MEGLPPRDPSRSSSKGSNNSRKRINSSEGKRRTSPRRNSNQSPSSSSNIKNGETILNAKLRSVLSHPLGLPLLLAMHEKEAPDEVKTLFPPLKYENDKKEEEKDAFKNIFNDCVKQWIKDRANNNSNKPDEPALTKKIAAEVNNIAESCQQPIFAHSQLALAESLAESSKSVGIMDIVLSSEKERNPSAESTPLMIIEVGLNGNEWFQKFDQGVKYLQLMCKRQKQKLVCYEDPLLLAIITIDDYEDHDFQMGIFLCTRKHSTTTSELEDDFRIMLLRQFKTNDLGKASDFFGLMLWLTKEFKQWRKEGEGHNVSNYEYFSSNCCRIGERVRHLFCYIVVICCS
jgi:hypothetical protein